MHFDAEPFKRALVLLVPRTATEVQVQAARRF